MNKIHTTVAVTAVVLVLGGCGKDGAGNGTFTTETMTTRPSLAVSVSPVPPQYNQGRDRIKFDPCVEIDDATIARAGFDPTTRERNDFISDNYSFIGCEFDHKEDVRGQNLAVRSMAVWSTNITLDEFRRREGGGATEIKVGSRTAITYRKSDTCYVAMQAPDGVVSLRTSTNAAFTTERPCDRINEVSETIESALGGR
ncbi:DUF3558 domain-containing protein [Nocardia ninae]|uniref:DUF3558 domain-containing protein n=1 Tax=Nocardia ninae NBRC 108245 TaxID=1210091 RepID=A0A511MIK4_9NOCA|nr:DUF3558 domain-containing protein [Nocardia ninae]GEM39917.1 hypothetical protein NN4_44360 [Nocardia ninae NBRC 108245]